VISLLAVWGASKFLGYEVGSTSSMEEFFVFSYIILFLYSKICLTYNRMK